jgi:leucyl-tRNA---protein transferase
MLNDVNEYLEREQLPLEDWEMLLTAGWDRVGQSFFHRRYDRYRILGDWMGVMEIMPLRYRLSDFVFSKSQRGILKHNEDVTKIFRPLELDEEKMNLFDAWYEKRFNKFGNIFSWVTTLERPFGMYEISFYNKQNKLIACSFFDVTERYQYSTVGMFHPDEAKRSLGTFTLMCEIIQGIQTDKTHHYPGHSYHGKSMYDYKKQYHNMEHYDWETKTWCDLPRGNTVNYIV